MEDAREEWKKARHLGQEQAEEIAALKESLENRDYSGEERVRGTQTSVHGARTSLISGSLFGWQLRKEKVDLQRKVEVLERKLQEAKLHHDKLQKRISTEKVNNSTLSAKCEEEVKRARSANMARQKFKAEATIANEKLAEVRRSCARG